MTSSGSTTHSGSLVARPSFSRAGWVGPYEIVEMVSAVTYRLDTPGRKRASKVVHVDRLWRHPGNGIYTWGERKDSATEGSDGDSDSDSDAEVDRVSDPEGELHSDSDGALLVAQDYHGENGRSVTDNADEHVVEQR